MQRALGVVTVFLAVCGLATAAALGAPGGSPRHSAGPRLSATPIASTTTTTVAPTTMAPPTTATPPTTTAPTTTTSTTVKAPPPPVTVAGPASLALAGCPVPPHPPGPPAPPPWHPATEVPDSSLPAVEPPAPWHASLSALTGKGMWIWLWGSTEGGDASAIVNRAKAAGLHQLWIRVGDSKYGFYGAGELNALVPVAHAAGIAVVAWGFPYLYDPAGDAGWTAQILGWRSSGAGRDGQAVDGYSADIERTSEGVDLTARRVAVYLGRVRQAAGAVPVIATVYPPLDAYWSGGYPYSTIATYVDAFAPMVYWECVDPGLAARSAVSRLSTLRPVHVIGQAFNMADVGGRVNPPSAAEITEFLEQARAAGAVGGSFWVWQTATAEEWSSVSGYRW